MAHVDGLDLHILHLEDLVAYMVQAKRRSTRIGMGLERVVEILADDVGHPLERKNINRLLLFEINGPDVIQTGQMVFVFMGDKNRIHTGDVVSQKLHPQIRTRINKNICVVHLHKGGGSETLVARIRRMADRTGASHHGHALRCSGS